MTISVGNGFLPECLQVPEGQPEDLDTLQETISDLAEIEGALENLVLQLKSRLPGFLIVPPR